MNKIIGILALLLISMPAFSQYSLSKGRSQINAGVGLSSWGVPVYVGFDYGAGKDVTIGAEVSHRSYRENWRNDKYRHSITGISANVNYHFNSVLDISRDWDFYAGLNLGFYAWSSPNGYNGDDFGGLGLGAQIGGRYFFSNKAGINLEFGGGNAFSGGKIGLTFKL